MKIVRLVCIVVAAILVAASFLPMIETHWWAIRLLDFPRLQIAATLILLGAIVVFLFRHAPLVRGVLLIGIFSACATHTLTLWPYRPGGKNFVSECSADRRLSVMVANVRLGNRTAAPLLAMVREEQPDLLLVMETDDWWDHALHSLDDAMPNKIEKITGSYYGIHFFSRLPLVRPEIQFLAGQDTPSVVTAVTLRNGEIVDFLGVHPKPPQPWQSSLPRDADLYAAALLLRDRTEPGIIAGDLNATPWEKAINRMRRIARLIDPRHGYGYVPTFSTEHWFESWPLDHVFHEGGFATMSLKQLGAFGSDHFPYIVRLCRTTASAGEVPPVLWSDDLDKARSVLREQRRFKPVSAAALADQP